MKFFLCGQGEGAEACLRQLWDTGHDVAVWTHHGSNFAEMAEDSDLFISTHSVNSREFWPFQPNLLISVGYLFKILPDTLQALDGRAINCHYSLLPRHRGRSSVPWAIFDGDAETGITWHWVDEDFDTGRVFLSRTTEITPEDTQASIFAALHSLVARSFGPALRLALAGARGNEQQGAPSYHHAGPPCGGEIDSSWPDDKVERFIRAMTYPPRPYARMNGREVRTMEDYWGMHR